MSRDSKRKLAIVAGISECLVYAEAKYCAFEIHGEPKYYVCPRTEYCCNFGCCVSPGFQIYHLWYYWLLVIIMFLVCSGGGWWYRYWLQGRYRAAASAIPSRAAANSRGQSALPGRTCPAQQASITYNSARNTVLLHRMWKGGHPHRGPGSSPAYPGPPVTAAASSAHFQNTNVVLNDVNCPYYQLYGPPPSYETVIAQTRGKISSPLSPESSLRNVDSTSSATGSSNLQNSDITTRCYNHSPYSNNHPSQTGSNIGVVDNAISCYEQTNTNVVDTIHRLDTLEATTGFSRYPPSYAGNGDGTTPVHTAGRQEACHLPLHYHGGPIPPLDYHEEQSSAIAPDTYRICHRGGDNIERLPSYNGDRNAIESRTRRGISSSSMIRDQTRRFSQVNSGESHSSVPDLKIVTSDDSCHHRASTSRNDDDDNDEPDERYARNHGGSLKFYRTRGDNNEMTETISEGMRRVENFSGIATPSSSRDGNSMRTENSLILHDGRDSTNVTTEFGENGSFTRSTRKGLLGSNGRGRNTVTSRYGEQHQTNPSDNVILEPLTSVININDEKRPNVSSNDDQITSITRWRTRRNDDEEKRRKRLASPGARLTNNDDDDAPVVDNPNKNHESKHNKLDRSKSLD